MTTEWRIVPVDITSEIRTKMLQAESGEWSVAEAWQQIIAAAPRASEDEALVDRLTGVAWRELFIMLRTIKAANIGSEHARFLTLNILKALETPHD